MKKHSQKFIQHHKAKIHRQFKQEFGIHFQVDELRFAFQFLNDVIDETISNFLN